MTALLDQRAAERLAKLLGMLGSDQAGEVAAAGRKAHQLIRNHGITWSDIILSRPSSSSVEDLVDEALRNGDGILNSWEEGFVRGIRGRQHLTRRQLAKLDSIVAKVRAYAGTMQ